MPTFITLDGIDGVGKSTQIAKLADHLSSIGDEVLTVRDPGSTEIGQRLRAILLDSQLEMHRRTEAMLFMASRCEMIEKTIRPALQSGKSVISDRFLLANVVYQSIGGDVSADTLWELGHLANDGMRPDLTVVLDMPAREAIKRLDGPADRMESRGVEYMESVRQAFLEQLPRSSEQTVVINADQDPAAVTAEMLGAVDRMLQINKR
ncbi:MAG: dTMP kinase [Pirellulaceae bacterium]|nr:dTMP kinase [Pirellulaceae bacterium]